MTDAEWAAFAPLIRPAHNLGRPPADRRRTWDAIFWIACSRLPWRCLPDALGKADTAHRTLRRAAHEGLLDRLLLAVSRHPLATEGLAGLEWRIARAWRRAVRLMAMGSLLLAKNLGMASALPAATCHIPDPTLSGIITRLSRDFLDALPRGPAPGLGRAIQRLLRLARGNLRAWRTTA
jgi:transposase